MDRDDVRKSRDSEGGIPNFEALLSALAPRAAGIDRDRLMFLAGQASAPVASGGRQPPGGPADDSGAGGDARLVPATASAPGAAALTLTLSQRERGPKARWAWPAAFSAMTALAASLLVMLANRPEPQVIERIVRVPVESPRPLAPAGPRERNDAVVPSESAFAGTRTNPPTGDSYLRLRGQVLALGVDSWMRSVPPAATSSGEPPATYRELRESLLQ